jgi:hypothetical protein
MATSIKVRFNLGRGVNYMKWKVYSSKSVDYYDPMEYNLTLHDCVLKNNKNTALSIFQGKSKSVCSWVLCKSVIVSKAESLPRDLTKISYNPKVFPGWLIENTVVDGHRYDTIWSQGKSLFTKIEI